MKAGSLWTLNRYQLFGVLAYSATFPVLNSLGGVWGSVALFGWAPFLPVVYLTASVGASLAEAEWGAWVGTVAGIAVQAWVLLSVWTAWRRWRARTWNPTSLSRRRAERPDHSLPSRQELSGQIWISAPARPHPKTDRAKKDNPDDRRGRNRGPEPYRIGEALDVRQRDVPEVQRQPDGARSSNDPRTDSDDAEDSPPRERIYRSEGHYCRGSARYADDHRVL
jgi:hypothetical protein